MNLKKSTLAAGVAVVLGVGAAGQAVASVYAGSSLIVDQLTIGFSPAILGTDPVIQSFVFTTQANANVLGVGTDASGATCDGDFLGGGTTCGASGSTTLYPNGTAGTTTSGTGPANVGNVVATPLISQAPNTASFFGPAPGNNFATADAIIDRAELVDALAGTFPSTTATRQISEAEIATSRTASASTNLQSTTTLEYGFTLDVEEGEEGAITISFLADVDLLAEINDLSAVTASAKATTNFNITLTGTDDNGDVIYSWTWVPTTVTADCGATDLNLSGPNAANCIAQTVSENLNAQATVGGVPTSRQAVSLDGLNLRQFGIEMDGLIDATYSLVLTGATSDQVIRRVPEPGSLLLLGGGLAGLAATVRRRKKA